MQGIVPGTAKVAPNAHGITGRIPPKVVGKWPGRALNHGFITINNRGDDARATRRLKKIAKKIAVPLRQFVRDILNGQLDLGELQALWHVDRIEVAGEGRVEYVAATVDNHPLVAAARGYAARNNIRGQA